METQELLRVVIDSLALIMLLIALGIASAKTVGQMIRGYRGQSILLALITVLAVFETRSGDAPTAQWSVVFFSAIPVLLAIMVRSLLARATVPDPGRGWPRRLDYWFKELPRQATPIWLQVRISRRRQINSLFWNLLLTVAAFFIAFTLVGSRARPEPKIDTNILAISIALLLVGLLTMTRKQDIIAQIMGLLVMEHGMFLAVIKILNAPTFTLLFVISLFLYIIITLLILLYLLPELHQKSGTLDVKNQEQLKG